MQKAYEDAKAKFDSRYEQEQLKYEYAMDAWGLIQRDSFSASSGNCLAMATCAEAIVNFRESVVAIDEHRHRRVRADGTLLQSPHSPYPPPSSLHGLVLQLECWPLGLGALLC